MIRRRFHREEMKQHFNSGHLDCVWATLTHERPFYYSAVWRTLASQLCKRKLMEEGWCQDEGFTRLRNGLITFQWALGHDLTTELIGIGQIPMLISLMDIETPMLDVDNVNECVDLQAVLLLVATRGIAQAQTFLDPNLFMVTLLDELNLGLDLTSVATETAVRADILKGYFQNV